MARILHLAGPQGPLRCVDGGCRSLVATRDGAAEDERCDDPRDPGRQELGEQQSDEHSHPDSVNLNDAQARRQPPPLPYGSVTIRTDAGRAMRSR